MNKIFRYNLFFIYASSLCSGIANGILLISIPWMVLTNSGSVTNIAIMTVVPYIATVILMPKFSSIVDRFPKKNICYSVILLSLILYAFLITITTHTDLSLLKFYLIISVAIVIRAMQQLSFTILSHSTVSDNDYYNLNRHLEFIRQLISLLSGVIIAILVSYSLKNILICSILLTAVSVALIIPIKAYSKNIIAKAEDIGFLSTVSYLMKNKTLFKILLILIVPYILVMVQNIIYPIYFLDSLSLDKIHYALFTVPYGLGALSSIYISKLTIRITNTKIFLCTLIFLYATNILLLSIFTNYLLTYFVLFNFSLLHCLIRIERMTIIMKSYDTRHIARICSFFDIIALISIVMLSLMVGLIIDYSSCSYAWLFLFTFTLISFIFLMLSKYSFDIYNITTQPNRLNQPNINNVPPNGTR